MTSLNQLLGRGAIVLDHPCEDWRAAVRASGDLLVASGVATDDYTDAMIETVEELGPYIVIAPGLALAHARPSPAVLHTGMSWLRPAEPVAFGHTKNDPVGLVIGLATTDHEQHRVALAQLATLLADREKRRALESAADDAELRTTLTSLGEDT